MGLRAASRLESLGFQDVYLYPPGMDGWVAADLPTEGPDSRTLRAGDVADLNVLTCRPDDRVGEVRERLLASGGTRCIVVNERRVVLGRVRGDALDAEPDQLVEFVMEPGPTTARPGEPLAKLIDRMQKRRGASIILTTPDGVLTGVLRREDGERRLADQAARDGSAAGEATGE